MKIQSICNYKMPANNEKKVNSCTIVSSIKNYARIFFSSPIVQLSILLAGLILFNSIGIPNGLDLPVILITNAIGLSIIGVVAYKRRKMIEHEFSIYSKSLSYDYCQRKGLSWYTQITDGIYLGGIPLNTKKHIDELLNLSPKENKLAVLSIEEAWELEKELPFVSKVTPTQWKENNVTHLILEGPDHIPLTLDQLEKGIRFIQEQRKLGKKVYIHCKAGRGRSATIVACYLMVEKGMTVQEAVKFIENKRVVTLYKESKQIRMNEFYKTLCPKMRRDKLNWFQKLFY